jgi:hypothetical protein
VNSAEADQAFPAAAKWGEALLVSARSGRCAMPHRCRARNDSHDVVGRCNSGRYGAGHGGARQACKAECVSVKEISAGVELSNP